MFLNLVGITMGRATSRALWFTLLVSTTCCASALCSARTLTFDDVPSGTKPRLSSLYRDTYRITFDTRFQVTDHTASAWGPPSSVPNVLTLPTDTAYGPGYVTFGYSTPSYLERDPVISVGACFSTDWSAMIRVTAYDDRIPPPHAPLASIVIGATGESWSNRHVEICAQGQAFTMLEFEGINSPNDLLGFCLDDMTITYVPEPSSLLALCAGIGAMGAVIRRRRG